MLHDYLIYELPKEVLITSLTSPRISSKIFIRFDVFHREELFDRATDSFIMTELTRFHYCHQIVDNTHIHTYNWASPLHGLAHNRVRSLTSVVLTMSNMWFIPSGHLVVIFITFPLPWLESTKNWFPYLKHYHCLPTEHNTKNRNLH